MPRLSFLLIPLLFLACNKEADKPETAPDSDLSAMLSLLEQEAAPLSSIPLSWEDDQLKFLDIYADAKVVGLGEATHGSAEFFEAKHRIFQYLVEQHGYKVFAIEADFGESLFINEAVQAGDKAAIEVLMKDKMHFWTWNTEEVKQLLEWMCDYNVGKPAEERLQYVGVDCQYNTFHPGLVIQYLDEYAPAFTADYNSILTTVQAASNDRFDSYSEEAFNDLIEDIETLKEEFITNEKALTAASSEKDYQLYLRLLELCKQSAIVVNAYTKNDNSQNYRDQFMAYNTIWWQEQLDNNKAVVWAHNAHVMNSISSGAQGYHLKSLLGEDYQIIGFSFSQGTFTAVRVGGSLGTQRIEVRTVPNSVNGIFHLATYKTFAIALDELEKDVHWMNFLGKSNLRMLAIGSIYNENPTDYYRVFRRVHYDMLIYFDQTRATRLL